MRLRRGLLHFFCINPALCVRRSKKKVSFCGVNSESDVQVSPRAPRRDVTGTWGPTLCRGVPCFSFWPSRLAHCWAVFLHDTPSRVPIRPAHRSHPRRLAARPRQRGHLLHSSTTRGGRGVPSPACDSRPGGNSCPGLEVPASREPKQPKQTRSIKAQVKTRKEVFLRAD